MYCVSEHKWKDPCTQLEAALIPISVRSFAVRWRALYPFKAIPFTSSMKMAKETTESHHISSYIYNIVTKWVNGALCARIAQNVKKPPLTVNVMDFDFSFVSIWVPWSPLGPKKSWYIGSLFRFIRCREKQGAFCSILKLSLQSLYTFFGLFWRLAL